MISVRSAIPGYAGFADPIARRLSDQQVRAWVGERLAALGQRLPDAFATPGFEETLERCQFGDQHVIKALEDGRFADADHVAAVEAEDAQLLTSAARAEAVDAAGIAALIAEVSAAIRHRADAIVALRSR